jgi:hypothetical protein
VPLAGGALRSQARRDVSSSVACATHSLHPKIGAPVPQAECPDPFDGEVFLVVGLVDVGQGLLRCESGSALWSGDHHRRRCRLWNVFEDWPRPVAAWFKLPSHTSPPPALSCYARSRNVVISSGLARREGRPDPDRTTE